ncbi:MAG: hypothetical protein IT273_09170 [Chitinophagales bacterium]|nr:hypothetical protein [Chitinophagales bacterium]
MEDKNPQSNAATTTEKQISEWKKKYGKDNVIRLSVEADGQIFACYVVKPDGKDHARQMSIYQKAFSLMQQNKAIEAGQFLLNECWLGGDEVFKGTNAKIQVSACMKMVEMLGFLEVTTSPA